MLEPKDIDISSGLLSTFGCSEFEQLACAIIRFLQSDEKEDTHGYDQGEGWTKCFRMERFKEFSPSLFAMFCASGWLITGWFPKYVFTVSPAFVERVNEKV